MSHAVSRRQPPDTSRFGHSGSADTLRGDPPRLCASILLRNVVLLDPVAQGVVDPCLPAATSGGPAAFDPTVVRRIGSLAHIGMAQELKESYFLFDT